MYGYNYNPYNVGYQQSAQQTTDDRIWVQNEYSAEAYLVAPNSFVRLWDANKPIFYEKRADASGRPMPIESYEYKRYEAPKQGVAQSIDNALQGELKAIKERLTALERGVSNVSEPNADTTAV